MNWLLRVAIAVSTLLITSCDGTIFKTFDLRSGQSLSIDARQRLFLVGERVKPYSKPDGTYYLDEKGQVLLERRKVVCAEPSPDALVAKAAALAASATSPQVAGSLGAAFTEAAASMGTRTPTIQLLRDGLFRACEAFLNGALGEEEYHQILFNYDRVMTALIIVEATAGFKLSPNVAIVAGQANVGITPDASKPSNPPAPPAAPAVTAGTQPGSSSHSTAQGGYTVTDAGVQHVKEVMLGVANAMLADPLRWGFCVAPSRSNTDNFRNQYFHSICHSISELMQEQVNTAKAKTELIRACSRNLAAKACEKVITR